MMTTMETRMSKWADKRKKIELEAKEIADAIKHEETTVFDEMMDNPIQQLDDLFYSVKWDGTK